MEERWGRALPERLCSTLPANAEDDPLYMVFMGGNSRSPVYETQTNNLFI